jgi:hypothetical protein
MSRETRPQQISPEWLEIVQKQVNALRFGVVQITVHESRVVQIETTEKVRLGQQDKGTTH